MKYFFILTLTVTVCSGCSSVGTISLQDRDLQYASYIKSEDLSKIEKISSFYILGANLLSDKYLTITADKDDKYLIELADQCHDLYHSTNLYLDRFAPYTLSTEDAFFVNSFRCRIGSIYPLTKAQHVKILEIKRKPRSEG